MKAFGILITKWVVFLVFIESIFRRFERNKSTTGAVAIPLRDLDAKFLYLERQSGRETMTEDTDL